MSAPCALATEWIVMIPRATVMPRSVIRATRMRPKLESGLEYRPTYRRRPSARARPTQPKRPAALAIVEGSLPQGRSARRQVHLPRACMVLTGWRRKECERQASSADLPCPERSSIASTCATSSDQIRRSRSDASPPREISAETRSRSERSTSWRICPSMI